HQGTPRGGILIEGTHPQGGIPLEGTRPLLDVIVTAPPSRKSVIEDPCHEESWISHCP
ncbi:hypothetical protein A2U01_0060917, partial [Trifolium medium]|nr:hypothetical protein [Trifolium medium]